MLFLRWGCVASRPWSVDLCPQRNVFLSKALYCSISRSKGRVWRILRVCYHVGFCPVGTGSQRLITPKTSVRVIASPWVRNNSPRGFYPQTLRPALPHGHTVLCLLDNLTLHELLDAILNNLWLVIHC